MARAKRAPTESKAAGGRLTTTEVTVTQLLDAHAAPLERAGRSANEERFRWSARGLGAGTPNAFRVAFLGCVLTTMKYP